MTEEPKERRMTAKQKLFCEYYLSNKYNATEAARLAGYSQTGRVCESIANENMRKPAIKSYIGERMNEAIEKAGVGLEWTLDYIKKTVEASYDGRASKEGLVDSDGVYKGLQEINKMRGSYAPTKAEVKDTTDECAEMEDLIAKSKTEY